MSIRLRYYLKNGVLFAAAAAALIMAFAPFTDGAGLRTRAAEFYENAPEKEPPMININTASVRELQKLKGVGEVTAAAIVAYREEHGAFHSADELDNVYGIGEATVEKLRPYILI